MSLHAVKMLGINITNSSRETILKEIQKGLEVGGKWGDNFPKTGRKTLVIVTPNPEQVVYARGHSHFREVLNRADVAIPDGVGLVWASKILSRLPITDYRLSIVKAIPGVDLMDDLVRIAEIRHVPVALIGGSGDLALKAFECLRQKHPGLTGLAMGAPEFVVGSSGLAFAQNDMSGELKGREFQVNDSDLNFPLVYENLEIYIQQLTRKLKDAGVQMVFVGLGAPKQEYLIEKLRSSFIVHGKANQKTMNHEQRTNNLVIFMSVGGSFDVIAGRIRRAPVVFRSIGFEWLWRLIIEPWRIRRQLALLKFAFLVLKERYRFK